MSPATTPYFLLFILVAAIIDSSYFGYSSVKKVRVEAKDAICKQQLANVQLKLFISY